jgi:ubiquinone/menaquinone biosynthesis C-methylase UbiE
MTHKHKGSHQHGGMTSEGMIDAEQALQKMDLKSAEWFFDAGCGDGHFTIPAAEMVGDSGKVFAVDVWEDGIKSLNQKLQSKGIANVFTSISDLTLAVPIDDNCIDVCLISNLMHGFAANDEIDAAFGEITRVLKPGGRLAIIEFKKTGSHGPPPEIRLAPEDVEREVTPFGFRRAKVADAGPMHYLITFLKSE